MNNFLFLGLKSHPVITKLILLTNTNSNHSQACNTGKNSRLKKPFTDSFHIVQTLPLSSEKFTSRCLT